MMHASFSAAESAWLEYHRTGSVFETTAVWTPATVVRAVVKTRLPATNLRSIVLSACDGVRLCMFVLR